MKPAWSKKPATTIISKTTKVPAIPIPAASEPDGIKPEQNVPNRTVRKSTLISAVLIPGLTVTAIFRPAPAKKNAPETREPENAPAAAKNILKPAPTPVTTLH